MSNFQVERLRLENAELRKCFGDTGVNLNQSCTYISPSFSLAILSQCEQILWLDTVYTLHHSYCPYLWKQNPVTAFLCFNACSNIIDTLMKNLLVQNNIKTVFIVDHQCVSVCISVTQLQTCLEHPRTCIYLPLSRPSSILYQNRYIQSIVQSFLL